MTRALLTEGAAHVLAVERDSRAIAALTEVADHFPGRLSIVEDDALTFDPRSQTSVPTRIVANLPYNIATPLLIGWLGTEPWPPWFDMMVLMFQREVAERIVAPPGSKTPMAACPCWYSGAVRLNILFDIAPSAFVPPPKVTSSLVRLVPRQTPLPCDRRQLERVTQAAFGQRRKMLRQSLKSLTPNPATLLVAAGIEPTALGRGNSGQRFVKLAQTLSDSAANA